MFLNGMPDITKAGAWFNAFNAYVKALMADFRYPFSQDRGFAYLEHLAGIAVIAVFDDGDIDIDNIAIF